MNERLPYDDELIRQLDDLPIPNEDVAWEDMKRRLEDDDDDGPVAPLVLKGCGGYALLLLLLVIVGLFIANPANWVQNNSKKQMVVADSTKNKKRESKNEIDSDKGVLANNGHNKIILKDNTVLDKKDITGSTPAEDSSIEKDEILKGGLPSGGHVIQKEYTGSNKQGIKRNNSSGQQNDSISIKNDPQHKPGNNKISQGFVPGKKEADSVITDRKNIKQIAEEQPAPVKDSMGSIVQKVKPGPDSAKRKTADTFTYKTQMKSGLLPQRGVYFGGGLGVHQLLPVAGQKSNPYNSLGRKSSLSDYLPSIYLRMYKDKKWFIQSEFRYGAPQYTKEILFSQKKIDTSGGSLTSASSRLKKTFYHQLPVSFNYFVLPGFSIGVGVTFNKFLSALVQQEMHKTNFITQTDSLVSTGLVSQKKSR